MNSTSLRRRLAGTAVTALVAGAGVLATAPSAFAKANEITIDSVSLSGQDVQVRLTYSCDPGLGQQLVANATALDSHSPKAGSAAGVIGSDRLVCDYGDHKAVMTLHTAYDTRFAKKDTVKVAVFYFDKDGYTTADQTAVAVL
ncbi:hypothetical protein [Streptomyces anandii]|uniref:hypothetical protein n=1 Tax=Streptomyces anandii TaxID=285454 RepID=UPI001675F5DB|nr:hypothetical protein [Streptomyces anandii]GGX78421.1 hypothetical protein GCM10010510_24200 [Streptomyces anandii JCM 4720]